MAVVLHTAADPKTVRASYKDVCAVLAPLAAIPEAGAQILALGYSRSLVEPYSPQRFEKVQGDWIAGRFVEFGLASAGELVPLHIPGGPRRWGFYDATPVLGPDQACSAGVRVPYSRDLSSDGDTWVSALKRLHDILGTAYGFVAVDRLWNWSWTSLEQAARAGRRMRRNETLDHVRGYHWADLVTPAQFAKLNLDGVPPAVRVDELADGSAILSVEDAPLEPLSAEGLRWRDRVFRSAIEPRLAGLPLSEAGFSVAYDQ
jgi:hypothetical protein